MDAYEALLSRSSPLELGEPGPDTATERMILAAALRAPDHGRLRPWRFLAIRGDARVAFGDILAEALARRSPAATSDLLDRERQKPMRAPLLLVVAARLVEHPKIPTVEQLLSAAAAAQNIMLASHALGFGAQWKTGDAAYDPFVRDALGLLPSDAVVGFMYIGTPKTMPKAAEPLDPEAFMVPWRGR